MYPVTEHNMIYEIRVRGHLPPTWSEWFDGLQMTNAETGDTVLAGPIADQAALFGIIARIQALNLTLLAITHRDTVESLTLSDTRERAI